MGIGAQESFSKIKLPAEAFRSTSITKLPVRDRIQQLTKIISRPLAAVYARPRIIMHASMVAAVSLVMISSGAGTSHTVVAQMMAQKEGYGTVLDPTAATNVAATVADKADLVIHNDVANQASTLNAQVALPTSDDETLAKRQVVSTAGDATRNVSSYTVQPGDTLSQIASQLGVTTRTLLYANNLDDADSIKPGMTLTVLPISGLLYTVQPGDTPDSLASKYQSDAAQILSYNNAEVKGLAPGQKIIIPDGVKPDAPKPAAAAAPAAAVSQAVAAIARPFIGGANGYSYGYCTWYVKNRRPDISGFWGNAYSWGYNARGDGYSVNHTPSPGAIAWTTAGYYGHVAYVEKVSGGQVLVSEMNYYGNGGGWGRVSSRWTSPGEWSGFIH